MSVTHCAPLYTRDSSEFSQQLTVCHLQEELPPWHSETFCSPPAAPFVPTSHYEGILTPAVPEYRECGQQGAPSDIEMTWQELMSLTELQGLDEDGQISAPDPPSLYALAPCCYDPPSATPDPDPDPYAPGPWTPCGLPLPQHRRPDPSPVTPYPPGPQCAGYPPGGAAGGAGWGAWAEPASQGPQPQPHPHPLPPQGAQAKVRGPAGGSSRDERRARALRLPLAAEAIVRLPVEDFNELASRYRLTEQQLALARDIRRRGKNKVAAQSCRRRKLEAIARLEAELKRLRAERGRLAAQRSQVRGELDQARARLGQLRDSLLSSLRDPRGRPYPRGAFELRQADDGEVYLVPRAPGAAGE